MTWGRAWPALAVCAVFDGLRLFFEFFWFFGPALATAYCASLGESGSLISGVKTLSCSATAGVATYFGFFVGFGVVMAMAVGLFGWLAIVLGIAMTNMRIITEHQAHAAWLFGSLLVSELPLIGSIPALTITIGRLYHTQIKTDAETLKKYKKEHAAAELQERQERILELQQARVAQARAMEPLDQVQSIEETEQEEYENQRARFAQAQASQINRVGAARGIKRAAVGEIPDGMREAA